MIRTSSFCRAEWCCILRGHHTFSSHPSAERCLGSFHLLQLIVKSAATNIQVQFFVWTAVFRSLGYTPRSETAGSCDKCLFIIYHRTTKCLLQRLYHLQYPHQQRMRILISPHICQDLGFFSIFKLFFIYFFNFFGCSAQILIFSQGLKLHPLQWKRGVSTAGLPGKSPKLAIIWFVIFIIATPSRHFSLWFYKTQDSTWGRV